MSSHVVSERYHEKAHGKMLWSRQHHGTVIHCHCHVRQFARGEVLHQASCGLMRELSSSSHFNFNNFCAASSQRNRRFRRFDADDFQRATRLAPRDEAS
ncbi:uncharacterized protein LOC143901418 [Temnothorax americanus]|uniref:uncharacterized protein LOC143901418 n=1 Tax=Temnothorax americanus TaxID=1964332 RepID=UPI00406777D3